VVYAGRKTPLRAIMDAGRRMLNQKWDNLEWEVCDDIAILGIKFTTQKDLSEKDLEKEYKEIFKNEKGEKITQQFDTWHRIVIRQKISEPVRESDKEPNEIYRYVIWYVPALMGDGQTKDCWYPYVYWLQDKDENDNPASANRKIRRYYEAPNPFSEDKKDDKSTDTETTANKGTSVWLVHVGELQPGDKIYFTPATFDFEFLDSTARRFEIYYEKSTRKRRISRPYLLDEVETLEKIWKTVSKKGGEPYLATTQIIELRDLIEQKRAEWFKDIKDSLNDETFTRFCRDAFVNANWIGNKENIDFNSLAKMAVKGYFADAVELYHHIMKVDEKDKNSKSEVINEH